MKHKVICIVCLCLSICRILSALCLFLMWDYFLKSYLLTFVAYNQCITLQDSSNNFEKVLYNYNTTIQIYRCREIQNTDDSPLFRNKMVIYFLTLVFRHKERETQFLLCWLFLHCPQSSPQLDWPGPESNLN